MDCGIAYRVEVLQKQADVLIDFRQAIDQRRYDRLRVDQRGLEDEVDRGTTHSVTGVLQRMGHVEQKVRCLIVVRIDGKPGD